MMRRPTGWCARRVTRLVSVRTDLRTPGDCQWQQSYGIRGRLGGALACGEHAGLAPVARRSRCMNRVSC